MYHDTWISYGMSAIGKLYVVWTSDLPNIVKYNFFCLCSTFVSVYYLYG